MSRRKESVMFNCYFEPPMNALSIDNDPVQGISIDNSRLTLPSGECTLSFSVHINDGTPVVNKKVELAFINTITHNVVDLPLVQDDKSHWGGSAVLPADASGQAQFSLKVPVPLPENLKLRAMLQDEPAYQDGKNTLTFSLKETVNDHTAEVDKLVIVSGDKQFTALDGDDFSPLVVRAFHGTTPVQNATVTFTSASPASASVVGTPAPTDADGVTRVLLAKHTQPGVFTVTARCGTASPVVFNLALGPQSSQLEVTFERDDIAIHLRNDNSGVCRAYVHTRGTAIGWPYIHGHAAVSAPEVIMLRQTAGGGESASVELISDATGLLSPVTGNGALEIAPKKRGNASVGFDIFIRPLRPVHKDITVRITDA